VQRTLPLLRPKSWRLTYITPEQEKALLSTAYPALATAIKICIRTWARPGCEFAKMTAAHITERGDRMEWTFRSTESKTRNLRIIRIIEPEILRRRDRLLAAGDFSVEILSFAV
jgi:hypothetical protein